MPRKKKREKSEFEILVEFHKKCGSPFEDAVQKAHESMKDRPDA